MTEEELNELQKLADAATPGPWKAFGQYGKSQNYTVETPDKKVWVIGDAIYHEDNGDHKFIAASRTAVPELISALREKDEEIIKLQKNCLAIIERLQSAEDALRFYANDFINPEMTSHPLFPKDVIQELHVAPNIARAHFEKWGEK